MEKCKEQYKKQNVELFNFALLIIEMLFNFAF